MRIVHVITRLILGGAQQNTVLTCKAQAAAGHDVTLVFGPIYGPEGSLLEDARASGAELVELPTMRRALLPVHDLRCYRALRRVVRERRPDVVHTHSSKAGIVGRAAAWAQGVPCVIHTVHGLPFHDQQPRWLHRVYVGAERWAAKRCHHLIAITPAMAEAFEAEKIAGPERFTVIPSGIDLALFTPSPDARQRTRQRYGIADDAPVVGIVARLDPLKGHRDLLEIFKPLEAKFPGLRYLFVGDGWDREALEQHPAVQSGAVVFTGLTPLGQIADTVAAMDVKVLPSYQEGQSRTLAEALLCGVPIVAYDVGGIGSVCIEHETGRLVPCGDRAALEAAIAWSLDNRDQAKRLAAAGAEHVKQQFDAAGMARRIEGVYREVLNLPSNRETNS